jgi:alkanesulfonate monooxygenase SsuD/methylene tetrahydromethanopterin reductase-like flavin-dependent oxidoreductase (luciferase family)
VTRQICLNAFDMNCVGHQSPSLWPHPRDRAWQYKDLEYWVDVARTLERGIFDSNFIADDIGYYDVYHGNACQALHQAAQLPVNDPIQFVSAKSLVTEYLGFSITASTGFERPSPFARHLSTDHHSKGRVGWNIVTSYLESGARNTGTDGLPRPGNRYDVADEYLEMIYRFLEGSWEDGAVLRDRQWRICTAAISRFGRRRFVSRMRRNSGRKCSASNGFGQTLTVSGSATFTDVEVDPRHIVRDEERSPYFRAFFKLVQLATLVGIARAAVHDVAQLVARRRRTHSHANGPVPAQDPQVLAVVGRARGAAYAGGAIVLQNAKAVQRAFEARSGGDAGAEQAAVAVAELELCQSLPLLSSLVLDVTTQLFDALDASATSRELGLDRYWRNARTLASHNPRIYKDRIVGDFAVNGTPPQWRIGLPS